MRKCAASHLAAPRRATFERRERRVASEKVGTLKLEKARRVARTAALAAEKLNKLSADATRRECSGHRACAGASCESSASRRRADT